MKTHNVKSWPQFFEPMLEGTKKHDMRNLKDRDYNVGDTLNLQEFCPIKGEYTGREAKFLITYITSTKVPCALSSALLDDSGAILSVERVF